EESDLQRRDLGCVEAEGGVAGQYLGESATRAPQQGGQDNEQPALGERWRGGRESVHTQARFWGAKRLPGAGAAGRGSVLQEEISQLGRDGDTQRHARGYQPGPPARPPGRLRPGRLHSLQAPLALLLAQPRLLPGFGRAGQGGAELGVCREWLKAFLGLV